MLLSTNRSDYAYCWKLSTDENNETTVTSKSSVKVNYSVQIVKLFTFLYSECYDPKLLHIHCSSLYVNIPICRRSHYISKFVFTSDVKSDGYHKDLILPQSIVPSNQ